jgi:uncharacterized protein YjbI with pentapeptide repeats
MSFYRKKYLLPYLFVASLMAANPEDVKKLDQFLTREESQTPLDLQGTDMRPYNLDEPKGKGKEFTGANMQRALFMGKDIRGIRFKGVNLEGANFEGADLSSVSFEHCPLQGVNFKNAKLRFGGFRNCDISKANFDGADLESISFTDVTLNESSFNKTNLFRVSMVRTVHSNVSWKNATKKDCSGF